MSIFSFSSYDDMSKLLENSERLPKWFKEIIQTNFVSNWTGDWDGYIDLKGLDEIEQITDEMVPELLQCIELFSNRVKLLGLENNKITSKGAALLFDGLKQMKSKITRIYLLGNLLDDECMKSLGEFIQNSKFIEEIYVQSNKIADKGIEILSSYLEGNIALNILDLYGNRRITDKSIPYLTDIVKKSAITDLDIQYTSISAEKQREVNMLAAIKAIKSGCDRVDLSDSFVIDESIEILSEHIEGNTTVKELDLFANEGTTDKSVPYLTDIVEKSGITRLNIHRKSISDKKKAEIYVLAAIKTIKSGCDRIDLSDSFVIDEDIKILSEHIEGNTTVKELDLFANEGITDKSVPFLIDIVKKSAITSFSLLGTSISDEKEEEINILAKVPAGEREIPIKSKSKSAAKIN